MKKRFKPVRIMSANKCKIISFAIGAVLVLSSGKEALANNLSVNTTLSSNAESNLTTTDASLSSVAITTLPSLTTSTSPPEPPYTGTWNSTDPVAFKNELSYVWNQVNERLNPTHNLRIGVVTQAWSQNSSEDGLLICGYFDLIQTKCQVFDPVTSECDYPVRNKTKRCTALVHRKYKSVLQQIDCAMTNQTIVIP